MSDGKEFPIVCSECGWHVWNTDAVQLDGKTYCEQCANKEPYKEKPPTGEGFS